MYQTGISYFLGSLWCSHTKYLLQCRRAFIALICSGGSLSTMMHYFSVLCRELLLLQRAYTKLFGPIQATLTAAMGINRVTSVLRLASSLIRDIRTRKSIREYSQQHFKQLSLDTLLLITHHTTLTWSSRNEPGSTIYMCVYLGY